MNRAPRRLMIFGLGAFFCLALFIISLAGILRPAENLASVPMSLVQQLSSGVAQKVSGLVRGIGDIQDLQRKNAEYESALVNAYSEIVDLREIKADYDRLRSLESFKGIEGERQFVTASVIFRDTTGLLRAIIIDRGSRDGLAVGMPVVTELGLVGRIYRVGATDAQVQLVTDINSFVSARLQTTRAEGSAQGTPAGGLRMVYIPPTSEVKDGDTVVTSGMGGNFPRGILIGQVTSSRLDDTKLFLEAQVRSLVDFSRLEVVKVITNFEPVDLSTFATPTPVPGAPSGQ